MRLTLGVLVVLACVAGVTGCAKKLVTQPQVQQTPLELMWPSDDGRYWAYRAVERSWDPPPLVVYPDVAHVPRVTMDTVATVLAIRRAGAHPLADTSHVQLQFNGTMTIAVSAALPAGIEVQVLEGISAPWSTAPAVRGSMPPRWLADLAVARPDLRGRLAASTLSEHDRVIAASGEPMFIHSGLWRRTAEWIGGYHAATTETLPDWKFLEADQAPGHRFFVQLLPDLAPDVILYGQVARQFAVRTVDGTIVNAVEVHYYVDYGISAQRDDQGNFLGLSRQFSCGSVIYEPGIGPTRDDERRLLFAGAALRPGAGDLLLDQVISGP